MSKLEIIEGGKKPENVVDLKHIAFLEDELRLRGNNITTRDCYIFAYQFCVAGDCARAEKYLNKIGPFYFQHGIYKDLYKALLSWSVFQKAPAANKDRLQKNYEFFIVARRSLDEFSKLNFRGKKEFMEMAKHFRKESTFTVI
jgi:hypothetical protein